MTAPVQFERTHELGRPARYAILGKIDRDHAVALYRQVCKDLLDGERSFVVDLERALYLDGRVLAELKRAAQRITEIRGSRLVFENVNDAAATLLELTHFDRLFTIRRAAAAEPLRLTREMPV